MPRGVADVNVAVADVADRLRPIVKHRKKVAYVANMLPYTATAKNRQYQALAVKVAVVADSY